MEEYDLAIVGGGCTGLGAAVYSARFNMKTVVFGGRLGGLIQDTHLVENYPGFKRLTGYELFQNLLEHAKDYSDLVDIKEEFVKDVKKLKDGFEVIGEKSKIRTKTILFATGTRRRKLDVPGEKEFTNKGVSYCATCLPPDESIIVNSSIKKIKDITPLTKVLTIDGTYKEISGFTKRNYKGKLIKIRPRFFNEETLLTPNHPVYSLKVSKGIGENYFKDFKFSEPSWVSAGELTENDCVLYPILKETNDIDEIKISDFIEVKKDGEYILPFIETHTSNRIIDKIKIDNDFMRLVGYYIAEGTANRHMLLFFFRKDEDIYINDVKTILKNKFGLEPSIRYEKTICRIVIYSKIIADFFKSNFEKYSYKKRFPHWVMILPVEKQKELIRGLWRGDGCVRDKDFCYVTSSRELTYQIRDILLRLGIIPSVMIRKKENLNRWINRIEGRLVGFNHDKYHITAGGQFILNMSKILGIQHPILNNRVKSFKHAWLSDKFAILPIREISEVDYEGQVLNVAVPETQTYVAKNFIVHNCDAPLFRNKICIMVGGSDSAAKEALLLSEFAKKVYIVYRKEKIHPEPINMKRVEEKIKEGKIEIINNTNVTEIKGDKFVTSVIFDKPYKGNKEFKCEGVFVEIGHLVESDLAKKLGVKLDNKGEIIIDRESKTNVDGIYAAGDVAARDWKQAIVGVAEGVIATNSAYEYIQEQKVK
ncbi:MAG: FAD-dependent oxidoreductase [Nanoarchaeota archaeon]